MSETRIRNAFSRLRRSVVSTVSVSDGLDRLHRRRRIAGALVPAFGFAAVILVAVGAFALFSGGDPAPVATTGTSSSTTTAPPDTSTPPTPPPPAAPAFWVRPGEMVFATSGDIVVYDGTATRSIGEALDLDFLDLAPRLAVSDRMGGIVFEDARGVWHLAARSAEPRFLLGPDARLQDGAAIGTDAFAVYTRYEAVGDATITTTGLLDLASGRESTVALSDGFEGGATRVSYGGGVFVITYGAEGIEWFEFFDAAGNQIDIANPAAFDDVSPTIKWFDEAVLSPDGTTLVYLESVDPWERVEGDTVDLVVWDVDAGTESARFAVPLDGAETDRVDFDGTTVVIGTRLGRTQQVPAAVFILSDVRSSGGFATAPVEGRPAIAGPGVTPSSEPPPSTTTTIPPAGPSAILPAAGLDPGYLTADLNGVKWHAGFGFEAPATTLTERDTGVVTLWDLSDDTYQGLGVQAFDDGRGGVVMSAHERGTYWLRPGQEARLVVSLPVVEVNSFELLGVVDVDGPTAYFMEYGVDGPAQLWTVRLEDGTAHPVARVDAHEAWYVTVSYGGGRFVVNTAGPECSRTFTIDPASGAEGTLDHAPESPCDGLPAPWHYQARISPDGSMLAYLQATRVAAGDLIELTPSIWGSPVDLVVIDLASGSEVLRRQIADDVLAVTLIHDFDGERIVVSAGPQEPAASTDDFTIIDLGCADCETTFQAIQTRVGLYR